MGTDAIIDARTDAALARLTDNEKECLRRRLRQQTAKEMALDLGVSPHAVEKRLKMARAKLGLSSSLEAARLMVASERYQQTAPHGSDLEPNAQMRKGGFSKATFVGATAMTILLATAVALAVSQTDSVSNQPTSAKVAEMPPGHVVPSEAEIVLMNQMTFHNADTDNSGYIDGVESPLSPSKGRQPVYRRNADGKVVPTGEMAVMDEDEIHAQFYLQADKDGDGRISFAEFHRWSAPNLVRRGIPAAWREDMRHLISPES